MRVDPGERRPKLSLEVARQIVETMRDSGMGPGDRYLPEAEAMRRHGVGRGTYREALRFLEHQGLIVMRPGPNGGPEIVQPGWPNLASTVALLLQFAGAPLSSVLDARVMIEPGLAELAARNATDEELAAMAGDLDAIERGLGSYRAFSAAYESYWRHLAESCHNELFAFLSPALRAIVNSAGFVPDERYRAQVLGRLRTVHAAVAARDAQAARDAMRELEEEFGRRLREGYPRQIAQVIDWSDVREPS
ncbi:MULTISPECIES: FadR/GntR family transcriptional regulator [Nonomuraea]|uniref:FadR/GntR family transcriptional regulator n=2 Tax=Nonomuraea TaxID=83681 RepID=A0ABW1C140_9ACTN|nr:MULTISPECIES: FCD domain-containing protein [Nonomuraea]MDA0644112.1 FCD domain-containing protein [Nonomuraea ferruginea]TXK40328.1 FadR family transcriptional regulator [Nonomuraea sp. C10]